MRPGWLEEPEIKGSGFGRGRQLEKIRQKKKPGRIVQDKEGSSANRKNPRQIRLVLASRSSAVSPQPNPPLPHPTHSRSCAHTPEGRKADQTTAPIPPSPPGGVHLCSTVNALNRQTARRRNLGGSRMQQRLPGRLPRVGLTITLLLLCTACRAFQSSGTCIALSRRPCVVERWQT